MPQMSQLIAPGAGQDLQQARTEQLLGEFKNGQLNSGQASDHQKLVTAAKSFEAILLGKWLDEAEQSFAKAPGEDPDNQDDMDGDPGANQFLSLGVQTLAQQIANNGGIGIASMIVRQMEARQSASTSPQPPDSKQVTPAGTEVSSPAVGKIKVFKEKDR
jgi:Rod binding domain-containing protein